MGLLAYQRPQECVITLLKWILKVDLASIDSRLFHFSAAERQQWCLISGVPTGGQKTIPCRAPAAAKASGLYLLADSALQTLLDCTEPKQHSSTFKNCLKYLLRSQGAGNPLQKAICWSQLTFRLNFVSNAWSNVSYETGFTRFWARWGAVCRYRGWSLNSLVNSLICRCSSWGVLCPPENLHWLCWLVITGQQNRCHRGSLQPCLPADSGELLSTSVWLIAAVASSSLLEILAQKLGMIDVLFTTKLPYRG